MSVAIAAEPSLLHAVPGRVRVHVPDWMGHDARSVEARLHQVEGVRRVEANPLTGNVLIYFDARATDSKAVLRAVQALEPRRASASEREETQTSPHMHTRAPRVLRWGRGHIKRARIAVRGLDRDPDLSRRVVERLERLPGVRARANPLTGRVLVEFNEHESDIRDLLAEITGVELPDLPGEDNPSHPLDPAPLVQSATRTAGAAVGLGVLAAQQAAGVTAFTGAAAAANAAGIIGLLQGFPLTRNGLRALLGRHVADVVFSGAGIVALALAGSPLGLTLTGAEALRLLTEVMARREAWKRYEQRLGDVAATEPGTVIRLEAGDRAPRTVAVVEGTGTAAGPAGLPLGVMPGSIVPAGARLAGGPFVMEVQGDEAFTPEPRPASPAPTLYDRYQQALGPLSLAYAALTGIATLSPSRAFTALLLVNPRTAVIGAEAATLGASARALRAGVVVVGTRHDRPVRLPDTLLLDGPRVLTDGLELTGVVPLRDADEASDVLALAAEVGVAAGSPWGGVFRAAGAEPATDGRFDGRTATARVAGIAYSLGPVTARDAMPEVERLRHRGAYLLVLRHLGKGQEAGRGEGQEAQPLALLALRPRLAAGARELADTARRYGVAVGLLMGDTVREGESLAAARSVARRAGVMLLDDDAVAAIRARQAGGKIIAFVSDNALAAQAFAACDLAIGLSSGRSSRFPARADLLAPDLGAVAAILDAGARRGETVRDSVALSALANLAGIAWGFRGAPGVERASTVVYITALGALADGWMRLRGGERPRSTAARLADPRPERWGRRDVADVLHALGTTEGGLTGAQAAERRAAVTRMEPRHELLRAVLDQARSPLTGILAAAAGLSLILGSPLDFAFIGATVGINVAVGVWQERRAGQAAIALERLGAATARVLRDGDAVTLPAGDVVTGDVLLLAPGDRVAADARLLQAGHLEVDEAALTGESLPVIKTANGGSEASRVVLEGSDVTVGTGRAVVVAVGRGTRMGATAAALADDEANQSPLGQRLSRMLRQVFPLAAAGGVIVTASGFVRGVALLPQLAIGASIALAAVPEGLPLLAGVGEAAVAQRLAGRKALVRRLSAVEALGRVDVACTDKTGTLTEGRLALTVVADLDHDARLDNGAASALPPELRRVLRAAALASPHPDAADAAAHPTDVAVVEGAEAAGLGESLRVPRQAEAPFDPVRSYHAAVVEGQLYVKGATETIVARCDSIYRDGVQQALDDDGRRALRERAEALASCGLRVLMAAQGAAGEDGAPAVADPRRLTALGFIGISDPLRADVREAVQRCHEAGIRVIMLTGDHPATARAIAREAGLLDSGNVLTGADIAELENGDLDRAIERATVIARVTPLDKLRIVESLQRHGHTVAMTGDGVNDAPALRLADVGVAMGRGGTEVARQAADVVLADDDFATLVEALVEGRSFWRNIRRALGLLLGGNLGELGLVVGASALGLVSPLTTRQILAVNLITDALPALAVALQPPEHRRLAGLAREGEAALGKPLRNEVLRRGALTATPTLAAYLVALGAGSLPQARTVAFASIVATQLAQTLDAGRAEGNLTRPVVAAVGAAGGLLVTAMLVPPARTLLTLAVPTPLSWALIGGATIAAVAGSRLGAPSHNGVPGVPITGIPGIPALPAPPRLRLLPSVTP